jgi:hypothetical protein
LQLTGTEITPFLLNKTTLLTEAKQFGFGFHHIANQTILDFI